MNDDATMPQGDETPAVTPAPVSDEAADADAPVKEEDKEEEIAA